MYCTIKGNGKKRKKERKKEKEKIIKIKGETKENILYKYTFLYI